MKYVGLCPKSPPEQHLKSPKQSRGFQFPFYSQDSLKTHPRSQSWDYCLGLGVRLRRRALTSAGARSWIQFPAPLGPPSYYTDIKKKWQKKNLWNYLGGVVKMLNFTLNGFHINKSKISKIAKAPGRSASQFSRYHEQGHQDMEGYGEGLVSVKRN